MKNQKNNQIILSIIGVAILVVAVIGVSFAFFNYTRTGSPNTLQVGRIAFSSTQTNIELENVFPTLSTNLNSSNSDTATITITGDTTYSGGIEYKVTLEQVNNTINGKEVPISIRATANNLGTEDSNYYTNRTNKTKIYLLNEEGDAYNGKYIAVGYIPEGSTGVNGSIDITAFIDTNKVAITDTYLNETTDDWVMGREVFTTTEWNSFASTPLSFKVKVEANEGIWVEQEKFLTMKNIYSDSNWSAIRANITSIEFHKDGIVPANSVTSFDVTDSASDPDKGRITLYTVDDGLGNNTYKAIIVANDIIYAPKNSANLLRNMTKLTTFNSENFKVDNVTTMQRLFSSCENLINISTLSQWNTSNVTSLQQTFSRCRKLKNINGVKNWNVEKVNNFNQTFAETIIENVDALSGWFFKGESIYFTSMFLRCYNLKNIDGLKNWNVSNAYSMQSMFADCTSLENASAINNWDINNNMLFTTMFQNTPVHPEFTKVAGTWDSNGTFTPNAS